MLRAATLTLAVALTATAASADTVTVESSFGTNSSTRTYQDTEPFYAGYYVPESARNVVTGLEKFDPSLGTLTGVAVTVSYDYDYDVVLQAGPVTNPAAGHTATAEHEGMYFHMTYRPDGGTSVNLASVGLASETYTATGNAGDPPASDSTHGSGNVSLTLEDITGSIDLEEFVGPGEVDALQAIIFLPYSMHLTLDNVDSATARIDATQQAGTIILQYTYTPIPEPASLALLCLGSLMALRRRRA